MPMRRLAVGGRIWLKGARKFAYKTSTTAAESLPASGKVIRFLRLVDIYYAKWMRDISIIELETAHFQLPSTVFLSLATELRLDSAGSDGVIMTLLWVTPKRSRPITHNEDIRYVG